MTLPSIRKPIWAKNSGGVGQDGRGVQVRSGMFDGQRSPGTSDGNGVSQRDAGEAFRDLDQVNRSAVKITALAPFEADYVEPMNLQLSAEPTSGIWAIRIVNVNAPDVPVSTSGYVNFRWDGQQAVITSIDGLVSGGGKYRFYFLVVG